MRRFRYRTIASMQMNSLRIVIATAEPLGAYHLVPLHDALRTAELSGHTFTHLIPYPEKVQGLPWEHVTADVRVLDRADVVVITGGGFTAWTELVAKYCSQLGIPFVVTELAYGAQPDGVQHPAPAAVSALSPAGAENLALYHDVSLETVVVTGTPLLDGLPLWVPARDRVLLLSSVEANDRDPSQELRSIADALRARGHDVVVRCHPREDRSTWDGIPLDQSPTAAHAAQYASFVVGYPGSAHPVVAALGVPVVALAPTEELRSALPPAQASVIPTWVSSCEEFLTLTSFPATPSEAILFANGPIGGSGSRVVEFWLRQAKAARTQRR